MSEPTEITETPTAESTNGAQSLHIATSAPALKGTALARRLATAMGQNMEWLETHRSRLLREHPDWEDHFVAVACCTPSKVLAVSRDRGRTIDDALQAAELLEAAAREGVPPGHLLSALYLGTSWD